MSVGEIRRRFRDRFDLDPHSQAVLDGHDVGDDVVVRAGQALMFVRRAGEKGAPAQLTSDQLTLMEQFMERVAARRRRPSLDGSRVSIEGSEASATSPEGKTARMPLDALLSTLSPPATGTGETILPTGTRAVLNEGQITIWVHETAPAVHGLLWLAADSPAPYGPGAKYRTVRLALPYLVILCVFVPGPGGVPILSQTNECFFRTAPLKSLDDELHYPALLNCSKFDPHAGRPLSWICTQHLPREVFRAIPHATERMVAGFTTLKHCLLETGFNYSSENHEASSWFTESRGVDPRLTTVEAWEAASANDPLFVLDVPWLNTGHTVRQVAERIFQNNRGCNRRPATAGALARVIFNHKPAPALEPSPTLLPTHEMF
jgi:hypothetical protein